MSASTSYATFTAPVPAHPATTRPVGPPRMPEPPPATGRLPGSTRRAAFRGLLQPLPNPQARLRKLILTSLWGALLGLGGLVVAAWAMIRIITGLTTPWYEPVIILVGLVGLGLTVSAFPLQERRGLSWIALALGTLVLGLGYIITIKV